MRIYVFNNSLFWNYRFHKAIWSCLYIQMQSAYWRQLNLQTVMLWRSNGSLVKHLDLHYG